MPRASLDFSAASDAVSLHRNTSLLFEIELDDGDSGGLDAPRHDSGGIAFGGVPPDKALFRLCAPPLRAARLLAQHALMAREQSLEASAGGDGAPDLARFAQGLADRGYAVWLRTGVAPPGAAAPAKYVNHTFVVANLGGALHVVDPQFREQFGFRGAPAAYTRLLASLPDVVVAAVPEICPLVELLAAQTEAGFKAAGLPMPAWRAARPMLARWLPSHAQDISVPRS